MPKPLMIVLTTVVMLALGGDYAPAEGTWCFNEPLAPDSATAASIAFAQCRASWSGGSSYCAPNSAFAGRRSSSGTWIPGRDRRR